MGAIKLESQVQFRDNIGQFAKIIEEGANAALDELEALGTRNVKAEVPRVKGNLAARSKAVRTGKQIHFISNIYYAEAVHDGSPPHTIMSSHGGPLAQTSKSKTPNDPGFFAPSGVVQHTGTVNKNPFLIRAYKLTWPHALDILDKHIN